jgi:hypothetical protein
MLIRNLGKSLLEWRFELLFKCILLYRNTAQMTDSLGYFSRGNVMISQVTSANAACLDVMSELQHCLGRRDPATSGCSFSG